MYLLRFDFALKYVAGKNMSRVDSLRRRVDWVERVERDNETQVILKKIGITTQVQEQKINLVLG